MVRRSAAGSLVSAAGWAAVEACLGRGISVNVTLLFSLAAYDSVIEAHMRALESRRQRGEDLAGVASVASFFLSRIDVMLDRQLAAMANSSRATRSSSRPGRSFRTR